MLAGRKVAVTPFGRLLTDKVIAELNPFSAVVETVIGIDPLCDTITFAAFISSEKLGGAATVTAIGEVRVSPPPMPVIVMVDLPAAAVEAARRVTVTGAAAVRAEEENWTVTPAGAPEAVSVTGDLKLPWAINVRVTTFEL